ncbi:lipase family protein [Nocardia sp. NPDC058658]|uniref:lipase family protein n=1 Tax=Nocardia sp. NPDC058658 TaxID=3346580 RepID=UPI00366501EC
MTETSVDDFYANTPLGVGTDPGTVLRSREITIDHLAGVANTWQLVYTTTTSFGFPCVASATVLEPRRRRDNGGRSRALVVFCPTFHGLGGACAPSQKLVRACEPDVGSIAAALANGWTVAVPDGIGLAITGAHPHHFLAAQADAHAVLDLARALSIALVPPGRAPIPVALWGYADGGRAVASAAEWHAQYASELDLRAVAAGAVIADPGALITTLDGGAWAGLAFAGMIGLARAYSHLPVDHILTDAGVRAVAAASSLDVSALLSDYRFPLARWCERPDPWNDPVWAHILDSERLGSKTPIVAVHLYHGRLDALVPIDSGRGLFAEYLSRGVDVSWSEYDCPHVGAADQATPDVFRVLRAGFALPPPGRTSNSS